MGMKSFVNGRSLRDLGMEGFERDGVGRRDGGWQQCENTIRDVSVAPALC